MQGTKVPRKRALIDISGTFNFVHLLTELWFLVVWLDESELCDVLPAKNIVLTEDGPADILNISEGCICKATFHGEQYDVEIVGIGEVILLSCTQVHSACTDYCHQVYCIVK